MGCILYAGLDACLELQFNTRHIYLVPCCPHNKFSEGLAERLPYPHGTQPRTFIQRN